MKRALAILFIIGATTVFGFAKSESGGLNMPEIKNIETVAAAIDSARNFDNFSAKWVNNTVLLNWRAYTTKTTKQFEIQRSTDGVTFKTIGIIFTIEESDHLKAYTFKDKPRFTEKLIFSYRIKQVNNSEAYDLSDPVEAHRH